MKWNIKWKENEKSRIILSRRKQKRERELRKNECAVSGCTNVTIPHSTWIENKRNVMQASSMCTENKWQPVREQDTYSYNRMCIHRRQQSRIDNGRAAFFVRIAFLRTQHVDDNDDDSELFALRAQTKFQWKTTAICVTIQHTEEGTAIESKRIWMCKRHGTARSLPRMKTVQWLLNSLHRLQCSIEFQTFMPNASDLFWSNCWFEWRKKNKVR